MAIGTVKWFNASKGVGYFSPNSGGGFGYFARKESSPPATHRDVGSVAAGRSRERPVRELH